MNPWGGSKRPIAARINVDDKSYAWVKTLVHPDVNGKTIETLTVSYDDVYVVLTVADGVGTSPTRMLYFLDLVTGLPMHEALLLVTPDYVEMLNHQ